MSFNCSELSAFVSGVVLQGIVCGHSVLERRHESLSRYQHHGTLNLHHLRSLGKPPTRAHVCLIPSHTCPSRERQQFARPKPDLWHCSLWRYLSGYSMCTVFTRRQEKFLLAQPDSGIV